MPALKLLFGAHGRRFWFDPDGSYSFSNIYVGDNVFLGLRPTLNATRSKIIVGSNVMFGPNVVVRGGNHTTTIVGKFISNATNSEKSPADDLGVVIHDDVWVGTRAVILHGVTVGRGSGHRRGCRCDQERARVRGRRRCAGENPEVPLGS